MRDFPRKLARIATVAATETDSFVALARLAGLNPARAFRGADLRGIDFGTDDITGFNFTRARLEGADLSRVSGYDPAMLRGAVTDATTRLPQSPSRSNPAPAPGYSPREIQHRLLAGTPIPSSWRPFVTELALGLSASARQSVYSDKTLAKARQRAIGTYLDTAAPLAQFPNLARLDLWGSANSDLTPLATITSLLSLDLGYTQASDLTPLAAVISLQSLDLRDTKVADLIPLSALTNLKSLNLTNTQITDLAPLADLTRLQSLDLEGTRVTDLTPVVDLPALRFLNLTFLPEGIEAALPRHAEIQITRFRLR